MTLLARSAEQEVHLILDVGNGSVAGSLVLFVRNSLPKIIYTKRLPIAVKHQVQTESLSAEALALLDEVVSTISTEGLTIMRAEVPAVKKVAHTYCVLSSPWYASKTKVLTIENQEPISITTGFVEELLKKEEGIFEDEVTRVSETEEGLSKNDIQVVEKLILQTKLNGYNTLNPYQKKARHIELTLFMSLASKHIVESIERIVGKYFYSKHLVFHSFSLVGHRVMSDMFPKESDFIFMDISAEVSDVSSVEHHILMETASFPRGRNYIVQKVAETFGVLPEIALSFINMYTSGHAEPEVAARIEKAYAVAVAEWGTYCIRTMNDVVRGSNTPSKIYVTVDEEVAPLFISAIKDTVARNEPAAQMFKNIVPVLIDKETIGHFVEYGPNAKEDPFLALESVFFNSIIFTTPL